MTGSMILVLGAFIALVLHRRRLAIGLLVLLLAQFALVGTGIFPKVALSGLQTRPKALNLQWKSKNWIVLLGAESIKWPRSDLVTLSSFGMARIFEAARLYYDCKKTAEFCKVLTSGGDPAKNGITEAEVMAGDLKSVGIPESDIVLETKSANTFQNAQFSAAILEAQGFDQIVLVTSGFHIARSMLYFTHFVPEPIAAPADYLKAILTPIPLSINFTMLDLALHEYAGILRYQLYNFMGWNPGHRASSP